MGRWIRFFIAIGVGLALALYYTWVINPVKIIDTTPDTLRMDYRTDYVLMVAEVYQVEGSLPQAARSLALLGPEAPAEIVRQAVQYAAANAYPAPDQKLLAKLLEGLLQWNPAAGGTPVP